MRVWLTIYESRGDVQVMTGLPVHVRALGAEAQVCAPRDQGATPSAAADLLPHAAGLVAAQFDAVAAPAEKCGAPVATGVMPTGGR